MKVLSLFSGIGGLELGLERAGMEIVGQVEWDSYCQEILARHWPGVKRYGDIRSVTGNEFGHIDLICGGFPCQPFSTAGKRKGTADDRWLWPEFYRIICEVRPRWVVIENVPGLLSIASADGRPGGVFAGILGELAQAGYDAEWRIVSAQMLGARHRRERVFIVAHTECYGFSGSKIPASPGTRSEGCQARPQGTEQSAGPVGGSGRSADMADAAGSEFNGAGEARRRRPGLADGNILNGERFDRIIEYLRIRNTAAGAIWHSDPADIPDADGEQTNIELLKSCGFSGFQGQSVGSGEEALRQKDGEYGYNDNTRPPEAHRTNGSTQPDVGRVADGISPILDSSTRKHPKFKPTVNETTAINKYFAEKFTSTPRVGHKIKSRVNRLKCLGNAVVPMVSEAVGLAIMGAEP